MENELQGTLLLNETTHDGNEENTTNDSPLVIVAPFVPLFLALFLHPEIFMSPL